MRNRVLFMTQAAMIAAIYVVLCVVFRFTSFGPIQVRVADALAVLPFFTGAAVPGLFVGCVIANLISGSVLLDVVFGSLATLLGAVGTFLLRKKNKYLAPLPPIFANAWIVPFVLRYGYGVSFSLLFLTGMVAIGEILSCGILGSILLRLLERYRGLLFKK